MGKLKNILGAFVLTFLMIVSFDIVQAAAPERLEEENLGTLDTEKATITVTNTEAGDELSAYKILDIYKNTATNEINYRYTDGFYAFLEAGGNNSKDYSHLTEEEYFKLTSGDITSGFTQTTSTLDVLVSDYAAYIKKNNLTGIDMVNNGTSSTLTTDTGSYLILPTLTDRIYAVMVGNLNYKEENGEWVKQNSTIVAKASNPSIKTSIGKIGQTAASFSIGEEYNYIIELKVPLYPTNAINNKLVLRNMFGFGIEFFSPDDVTIMNDSTEFKLQFLGNEDSEAGNMSNYQILNSSGDSLGSFIIISGDGEQSILVFGFNSAKIVSPNITITFKAKLNDTAKICRSTPLTPEEVLVSEFPSNALLSFISIGDPYSVDNASIMDIVNPDLANVVYAYTYKVQLNKHVLGDPTKKLGGAVFEIYSDSALTKKVGTVTTDDDGFAEFSGLGEGKYYLKEVTAPT